MNSPQYVNVCHISWQFNEACAFYIGFCKVCKKTKKAHTNFKQNVPYAINFLLFSLLHLGCQVEGSYMYNAKIVCFLRKDHGAMHARKKLMCFLLPILTV